MRVTDNMRYNQVLYNLASLSSRQADAAQQAQTGSRVNAPSDDPVAAAELARLSAAQSRVSANRSTISSVRGDAELAESSLQQASDLLTSAKELATQGSNDSLNASDRAALAMQVKDLKDQLLAVANTQGQNGYIFGGSATSTQAFSSAGLFQGNDDAHTVDIGNSTPTTVSVSGAKAFTSAGGRDVFGDLDALYTALSSNDADGIRGTLTNLDTSRAQINSAQAEAGAVLNKLDASDSVLSSVDLNNQQQQSEVGAADPAQAYSNLNQLNNALTRSVTVAQQILSVGAYKTS
ncbi:MAG TPA: flagellar hook-associated protein FlgL [Polyangiaceae bacterium]|jgi:flagellar hook-associated protein 3 FlgL